MLTVAVAVAFEFRGAACFLEIFDACVALRYIRAVPAFAFFAVSKNFGAAAITPIPSTACDVAVQKQKNMFYKYVLLCCTKKIKKTSAYRRSREVNGYVLVVIAVAVTLPIWRPATFFDRFCALITLGHVCAVTALQQHKMARNEKPSSTHGVCDLAGAMVSTLHSLQNL